jgi:hypothetical protein
MKSYVLKINYLDGSGTVHYAVINPGLEDSFSPRATRNPNADRTYATRLTLEQAEKWRPTIYGGQRKVSISVKIEEA